MDMRAGRTPDRFVRLILFRGRGWIVDYPARHTQAGVWAGEENRGHAILSARRRELLLTYIKRHYGFERLRNRRSPVALRVPLHRPRAVA